MCSRFDGSLDTLPKLLHVAIPTAIGARPAMRGQLEYLDLGANARGGLRVFHRASPKSDSSAAKNSPSSAAIARGSIGPCAPPRWCRPGAGLRGRGTAEEMAFVLAHAEVTLAVVEDQEQVDKIIAVSEQLPRLGKLIYDRAA